MGNVEKVRWVSRSCWLRSLALALALCVSTIGCIATVTVDPSSASYQKLATRSLQRALAEVDITSFIGKRVAVEVFTFTEDDYRPFAREFVIAQLKERGLTIVDAKQAELELKIFLPELGVTEVEFYFGTPELPSVVGTIPKIPIIGQARDVGRAAVEIYAFDSQSGAFRGKTKAEGEAHFAINTVLILFLFTSSDVDEKPGIRLIFSELFER